MKFLTPEIVYHNVDPIYACDIQPKTDDFVRLATGGFDCCVKIWKLTEEYSTEPISFVATLSRHEKRVNIVRWSPSGKVIASASDDGVIILWEKSNDIEKSTNAEEESNLEIWLPKYLRRHIQDVYALSWSRNDDHLISGSIDYSAIVWNLKCPNKSIMLRDHKHYVQGVAWDPLDNFVVTQSSDRTFRVYRAKSRICIYKVWKNGESKLFQGGSYNYFFRRLEFSPDGKLLITPAGLYERPDPESTHERYGFIDNHHNAAHIFVRHNLSKVAVTIPTGESTVIGVRFNPVPFKKRKATEKGVFNLPYRWIFCLVLENGVLIFDTEQSMPIFQILKIHFVSINDACWSPNGRCLVVCSTDGYCTYMFFDKGELGEPFTFNMNPQVLRTIDNIVELNETVNDHHRSGDSAGQSIPTTAVVGTAADDPTELLPSIIQQEEDEEYNKLSSTDECSDADELDDNNNATENVARSPVVTTIVPRRRLDLIPIVTTIQPSHSHSDNNKFVDTVTVKRRVALISLPLSTKPIVSESVDQTKTSELISLPLSTKPIVSESVDQTKTSPVSLVNIGDSCSKRRLELTPVSNNDNSAFINPTEVFSTVAHQPILKKPRASVGSPPPSI